MSELREKVAQLFCGGNNPCEACFKDADAAIALVRDNALEEAAQKIEALGYSPNIAAAIRPLKGRTT